MKISPDVVESVTDENGRVGTRVTYFTPRGMTDSEFRSRILKAVDGHVLASSGQSEVGGSTGCVSVTFWPE